MKDKVVGLMLVVVLVPAAYAAGLYWYGVAYGDTRGSSLRAAFLIALPLVVSGLVKWWDVWVYPPPKLGAFRVQISPSDYSFQVVRNQIIVGVVCVFAHLLANQSAIEELAGIRLDLDVPKTQARLAEVESKLAEARTRLAAARERSAQSSLPANDFGGLSADPFFADEDKRVASVDISSLTMERDSLRGQLRDHEAKVQRLNELRKGGEGDKGTVVVPAILVVCALATSMSQPKPRRFRSGQPIGTGG